MNATSGFVSLPDDHQVRNRNRVTGVSFRDTLAEVSFGDDDRPLVVTTRTDLLTLIDALGRRTDERSAQAMKARLPAKEVTAP